MKWQPVMQIYYFIHILNGNWQDSEADSALLGLGQFILVSTSK